LSNQRPLPNVLSHSLGVRFEILVAKNNVQENRSDMSKVNRSHSMWVQPDVVGLFSVSAGSFSDNVGLNAFIFSWNVGPKARCSRAEDFMLSRRYI
jgi:hypothetical protein